MDTGFSHRFRVRYAEVDPQSVVFNARYLDYADLIITEFWRDLGVHFTGEDALEFHVARAEVDFRRPIRADEWVVGRAKVERIGNSSIATRIALHGEIEGAPDHDLRAEVLLVHVHVDLETGASAPIPSSARAVFERVQEHV